MLNSQALQLLQQYLVRFAATANFEESIESIYSTKIGSAALHQQWLSGDFSLIPEIRVVSNGELGTANGAYAASLDEILVSSEFLAQHQDDPAAIAGLLLEELGHKLDRVLNGNIDTPGDEGAIFRSLVTGQSLSPELLAGLRTQIDRSVIVLNGQAVEIEKQDFFGDAGGIVTDDSIVGTAGNDNISPGLGNDTVNGGDGNDTLIVDYSANEYTGGNTKGIFSGFSGGFGSIFAFKGDSSDFDSVDFSNIENLNITGTKYDDNIFGSSGNDVLKGGLGDDTFTSNGGVDNIDGGDGIDTVNIDISSLNGNSNINLNQSNITLANGTQLLNLEKFTLVTGDGDDTIIGSNAGDTIISGAGNDTISGGSGNDTFFGATGNDTIAAGLGNDTVNGNEGNDTLIVDYSANEYTGGNTKGISSGFSAGFGSIFAFKGDSSDFDSVDFSNIENLNITGTKYDDRIVGSTGNDVLKGGLGDDTFTGNGGNDTINGGNGDDTIFGGAGVDLLFGGAGADVFGFNNATEGIDKINDFVVGEDRLSISRAGFGGDAVFGSDSFAGGVLDISRFTLGTSATTSSQRFIYNNKSGALFFDADGVGGANQVRLAQLVGNPALTNTNFSIG